MKIKLLSTIQCYILHSIKTCVKCLRFNIILKLKITVPQEKPLAVNETKF